MRSQSMMKGAMVLDPADDFESGICNPTSSSNSSRTTMSMSIGSAVSLTSGFMPPIATSDSLTASSSSTLSSTSIATTGNTTTALDSILDLDECSVSSLLANGDIFVPEDSMFDVFDAEVDSDDHVACYVDADMVQFALSQLSASEREAAACCSLQYEQWRLALGVDDSDNAFSETTPFERSARLRVRDMAATDVMRRHLIDAAGHVGQAVRNCRSTIQFRQLHRVNAIRSSFAEQDLQCTSQWERDEPSKNGCAKSKSRDNPLLALRGLDRLGRVNIQIVAQSTGRASRSRKQPSSECSLPGTISILEKAVACFEMARYSPRSDDWPPKRRDSSDSVVVTVDFTGVVLLPWNTQLLTVANDLFFLFRHHYVGQLSRVYLVDPPLVVRVVWFLMHYLVGHRYARHIQCIDAERYHAMVIESDIESQLQCAVARTSSSPTNHALPWSRRDSISSATTSTTRLNCSTCVDDDGLENSSTTSSSSDTLVMSPLAEDGSSEFASRISKAVTMQEQQQRVIPLMVHTLQREQPLFVSERVEV